MNGDIGGPADFHMPYGLPPEGGAARDGGRSTATYGTRVSGPVRYLPVLLGGEVIGYLYASVRGNAASYIRRLGARATREGAEGAVEWARRLRAAHREGLTPQEALERWIGAEEHPHAGAVPVGTGFAEAESYEELMQRANPGYVEPEVPQVPMYDSEGTPLDRDQPGGWGPIGPLRTEDPEGYRMVSLTPVLYYPVLRGGAGLGYVWAAEAGDAAGFAPRVEARGAGYRARTAWVDRFKLGKREGRTPLETIRWWKGAAEDPVAGRVPSEAQEQRAADSKALNLLAQDQTRP
ncbi:hypothetical protein LG943_25905 [Streptomonospora sp. S1-112]|uniref:Uncharacterized protein n=1 Tax=Streptomonospora mangrovi TaxID=2883123 RepID=A0A9X3NTI3_9ACTN|nr:hypothetical protein [Streptomonospora mangrovi]MDA0567729.1 hypothetical protein [Streptomonospora mangrovi]